MERIYSITLDGHTVNVALGEAPVDMSFDLASRNTVKLHYPGRVRHATEPSTIHYAPLTLVSSEPKGDGKFEVTITDGTSTMTYEASNATGTQH